MSLYKKVLAASLTLLLASFAYAQPDRLRQPESFLLSARLFAAIPEQVFPFDQAAAPGLDERTDKEGHAPGFARFIPTDISLDKSGTWTTLPNGSRVWRLKVTSPGALALIPCFDRFYLPPGAMLHVYSPDRREVIGAFTPANNPANGRYNTGLIHGQSCILEYYEPLSASGRGDIHLYMLGHAYRMVPGRRDAGNGIIGFGGSETCEVNVRCPEGYNWQDQQNAVVRMMCITQGEASWCSGALVNNANRDCTPYVLTADHCYQNDISGVLPDSTDLSLWLFYFQYEAPGCADPATQGTLADEFMTGCSFVSASLDTGGNSGSDFALMKLNSAPPLSYLPYYAGWSNADVASENGVGIHHPYADIKKISTYDTPLQSVSFGGEVPGTHWQVQWMPTVSGHGVTEAGSSGSPLWDSDHHIVGTLTGGNSDCSTPFLEDQYGKFSYHWASNGTIAMKRLQNWLDPANTGIQTLDGMYAPCTASVPLDAAITAIQQTGTICDSAITVTYTLTNYGSDTLFNDSLKIIIDHSLTVYSRWAGVLPPFQSTSQSSPSLSLLAGSHTVTVTSFDPNGGMDGDSTNDTRTASFTVASVTAQYSFYLQTGDQGSAILWELTDIYNNVLYSGGPYADSISGQVINETWCLPKACYVFSIFSADSDGLAGVNMPGSFNIKDMSGAIVAESRQIDFGASDSLYVCNGINASINNLNPAFSRITIYPNPSSGLCTISNAYGTKLSVSDALGREILSIDIKDQPVMQIDLSARESGVYFFNFTSSEGNEVKRVIIDSAK